MPAAPRPERRLRIALVIDYSLDYLGGAQSAFLDQARLLLSHGHEVLIVAPWSPAHALSEAGATTDASAAAGAGGPGWAVTWRASGGAVLPISARVTLPGVDLPLIRNTPALRTRLAAEFARRDIDVVHTHAEFGLTAAAVSAARRLGIATVQTVHTFFWQAPVPRTLGPAAAAGVRAFARWLRGFPSSTARLADAPLDSALRGLTLSLGKRVDVVVSPSAHQAERLRAAGLVRVAVVPNALAPGGEPGSPLVAVDGPLRIVWVGRLVPEKRLLEWIDAVVIAARRLPAGSLEVEIIGEGPLRGEAERRADGSPVHFAGRLPRDAVQAHMRAAHLVALTSHGFDNQPVTIVEALHARRGVMYVDPALTEGVDVAGLRAQTPDAAAMADLLVRLARDPARVVAVSESAAEGSHEFDPDVHVGRILDVYAAAVAAASDVVH